MHGQLFGKESAAHSENEGACQHGVAGVDMQPLESDFMSARPAGAAGGGCSAEQGAALHAASCMG